MEQREKLVWEEWVALIGGLLMALMGGSVLLGWYTGNLFLLQLKANWAVMQFNTALSITCLGLSLSSLGLNFKRLSFCLAILGALLPFLTFLQYMFDVSFGVDQFLFKYDLPFPMKFPGRMAFNTSIALSLGGVSLFLLNSQEKAISPLVALICSSLILSVSVVSLISYMVHLEAELGWWDFARMAFETALSCFILGSATFIYNIRNILSSTIHRIVLPGSVMIGILSATLATWQVFRAQQYFTLQKIAGRDLASLSHSIDERIGEELLAIKRLVDRWQILGDYTQKLWDIDVGNYVKDFIGLNEISFYDQEFKQKKTYALHHGVFASYIGALKPSEIKNIKEGTSLIALLEKTSNFVFLFPLMVDYQFNGIIGGSVNLISILEYQIKKLSLGNYLISLSVGEKTLFSGGEVSAKVSGAPFTAPLDARLGDLKLSLTLTEAITLPGATASDIIILVTGFAIMGLAGALVYMVENVRLQKKSLETLNQSLQEERQKAEIANVAKGAFLATMSHEIRTPLNAIIGTSELLQETEINATQKKYIERVIHSSKVLLELMSDILDFSKIEAGGIKLESVPVDLASIAKVVSENLIFKAKDKHLDLFVECPSQPLPEMFSDPVRLQQIISNLMTNALKFTEKGYVLFRYQLKKEEGEIFIVRFEIVDTGPGIKAEDKPKLFQRFSQLDKGSTRKHGGVGLGLTICKKLVELMGGEIGFTSVFGEGSTFWCEIPFRAGPKSSSYSLLGKTIFLNDEKKKEEEILRKYLSDWGAKVDLLGKESQYDALISSSKQTQAAGKKILLSDQLVSPIPDGFDQMMVRPILPNELYKLLTT